MRALDLEIKTLVRTVSTAVGLVTPMRVEQARQLVMTGEYKEEETANDKD